MNKKQKKNLIRILISAILMIILHFLPVHGLLRFFLYLVPYVIVGYDVVLRAIKGIRNFQPLDENLLQWFLQSFKMAIIRKPLRLCYFIKLASGSKVMLWGRVERASVP